MSLPHLNVLRQPTNTLSVTLSHDNRAHEHLDWSDSLKWDLALTRRLVKAEFVSELILRNGIWVCKDVSCNLLQSSFYRYPLSASRNDGASSFFCLSFLDAERNTRTIDLVAQNQERCLAQILHGEQSVELVFAFLESVWVFGVDEEYNAADFGEIVFPQSSRLLVTSEVEGCEAHTADGEFLRCCEVVREVQRRATTKSLTRVQGWVQHGAGAVSGEAVVRGRRSYTLSFWLC